MYFHHTMTRNFAIDPAFSWDFFMLIAEKAVFELRSPSCLQETGFGFPLGTMAKIIRSKQAERL